MMDVPCVGIDELAARVSDGTSLSVQKGDERDVPMALAHALIRRGVRGLHLITLPTAAYPASGMMVDLLIGAGCVDSVETSGISLHELGAAPRFTQAVKAGRLKVIDATCPAVYAALQAGAKGQPFAPLRGLIGSDLLRHRSDYRVIDNPFAPGDAIVVVPAINADVAMFHAESADAEGNVWIGRDRDRLLAAHAADTVLVTVDRIVPGSFFDDEALAAGTIPAGCITALAVIPGAGLPLAADGRLDLAEVRRYQRAAMDDAGFGDYLRTRVFARVPQAA
jgi:glutaconate CoA-transferase, subunit A